jgi:uncharacterized cupin superfamily protein
MARCGERNHPVSVVASDVDGRTGCPYPTPYDKDIAGRTKHALGNVFDLTQFGVNFVTMEPGTMSAQRHWHQSEDEFVYVLDGEITLVTDAGETVLTPGMCAGFKAGKPDGHCLVNNTDKTVSYLEVGTRNRDDDVDYPDIDMKAEKKGGCWRFLHKDGTPCDENKN